MSPLDLAFESKETCTVRSGEENDFCFPLLLESGKRSTFSPFKNVGSGKKKNKEYLVIVRVLRVLPVMALMTGRNVNDRVNVTESET